jgi:glycosyltransferase involved in cell wall biosynthesis
MEMVVGLSHRLADLEGLVQILVYGGPTMWSDYRGMVSELDPRVASYGGAVSALEVVDLYRSGHVLLSPSRFEPFGLVVAEALASGLPTVVSDQVGAAETVSGLVCRRFPDGDLDAFERVVRGLLSDLETDEEQIRSAAIAEARRLFAPDVVGMRLLEILREVATRVSPGDISSPVRG